MTAYLWPIGDSLTAPYVPTLQKHLAAAKLDVQLVGSQGTAPNLHEGHGGYRVGMIGKNLDAYSAAMVAAHEPSPTAAFVLLGTNDLIGVPAPDLDAILGRYKDLLAAIRTKGASRIAIGTIPKTTLGNTPGLAAYNVKVRALAAAQHLPLVDLEAAMPTSLLIDGVHFGKEGAALMGNKIADVVIPMMRGSMAGSGAGLGVALAVGLGALLLARR